MEKSTISARSQSKKYNRVRSVDGVPTTVTLAPAPIPSHVNVSRVELASMPQDEDDYRRREVDCGEADRAEASR